MADTLDEYQFDLEGYVFGRSRPVFIDKDGLSIGDSEVATQDGQNPRSGARRFGKDVYTGRTWTFGLRVNGTSDEEALTLADEAQSAWMGTLEHLDLEEVVPLRYRVGGRTRRVYGRPRRFAMDASNSIITGLLSPSATFDTADHLHYADEEEYVELRLIAADTGGAVAPFEFPITFVDVDPDGVSSELISVGGTAQTAPVIEFDGPVLNPEVQIGDVIIGLSVSVPAGETVTIDARPWANTVTRSDGAAMGGSLSAKTWLTRARIRPGLHTASFRGIDATGGARCRVRWRKANYSL